MSEPDKINKNKTLLMNGIYHAYDIDFINCLRELALKHGSGHGDKLYPLEVLGAYHVVLGSALKWDFTKHGNPEQFIDNLITDWMSKCDKNRFRNRLERCISQDKVVSDIFLLRMNYAYLLEEGKDVISIHRGRTRDIERYGAKDEIGNVYGTESSALDLIKDKNRLDDIADSFYDTVEEISSRNTGTKTSIRNAIHAALLDYGYDINYNLDEVYHKLNEMNKNNVEKGLIGRIAYLAFETEIKNINCLPFSDS